MADRFLIAPLKSGLITALPAWQIAEDSFAKLENAYVFRGRVTKRLGTELMGSGATSSMTAPLLSRLRKSLGAYAAGAKNTIINVAVGQQFSVNDIILTVKNATIGQALLTTDVTITATVTGAAQVTFVGAGVGTLYFYPSLPVMGICNYQVGPINNQPTLAFDTTFAYQYSTTSWQETAGPLRLHGTDLNYVWTCNWRNAPNTGLLFISNFQVANPNGASVATDDPMYYWDGATWTPLTAAGPTGIFAFLPGGMARANSPYVFTARIIIQFKGSLLLLNTIENDNTGGTKGTPGFGMNTWYRQRCRFSFLGSPLAVNAWYQSQQEDAAGNTYGGGGFVDAPTQEEIVSAEFIKDRLIVYFERSTWEIVYTGNQAEPFQWQQINSELGSMSTFSVVPFDKAVLGIGDTGVHACSGANVERIDEKIPDNIFEISKKNSGSLRVAGIRDYFSELVYWAYPSIALDSRNTRRFPDKLLVYNYQNTTWSIWDDTFTAFGYFYQQQDVTWADLMETWAEYTLTWGDGVQYQNERRIIGGNQQGYVLLFTRDLDVNAQSRTITNVAIGGDTYTLTLTVIDHTLEVGDYVYVLDLNGINNFPAGIYEVITIVDKDNFTLVADEPGVTGVYTGGGTLFTVSQIDILSKQWNPYISKERSLFLQFIDFCVQKTALSQVTVDYYSSASSYSTLEAAQQTNTIMGTSVLETSPYSTVPFEQVQDLLWHRVYFQINGQFIQIRIFWSNDQLRTPSISLDNFTLEGLILCTQPTSSTLEI